MYRTIKLLVLSISILSISILLTSYFAFKSTPKLYVIVSTASGIYLVDINSGNEKFIGQVEANVIAPNGQRILFVKFTNGLKPTIDLKIRNILLEKDEFYLGLPIIDSDSGSSPLAQSVWSPDSQILAVSIALQNDQKNNKVAHNIWFADVPNNQFKQVTFHSGNDWDLKWSSTGTYLAYVSNRSPSCPVLSCAFEVGEVYIFSLRDKIEYPLIKQTRNLEYAWHSSRNVLAVSSDASTIASGLGPAWLSIADAENQSVFAIFQSDWEAHYKIVGWQPKSDNLIFVESVFSSSSSATHPYPTKTFLKMYNYQTQAVSEISSDFNIAVQDYYWSYDGQYLIARYKTSNSNNRQQDHAAIIPLEKGKVSIIKDVVFLDNWIFGGMHPTENSLVFTGVCSDQVSKCIITKHLTTGSMSEVEIKGISESPIYLLGWLTTSK